MCAKFTLPGIGKLYLSSLTPFLKRKHRIALARFYVHTYRYSNSSFRFIKLALLDWKPFQSSFIVRPTKEWVTAELISMVDRTFGESQNILPQKRGRRLMNRVAHYTVDNHNSLQILFPQSFLQNSFVLQYKRLEFNLFTHLKV